MRIVIPGTFDWYSLHFKKKVEKGLSKGFDYHNEVLLKAIEKLEKKDSKHSINLLIWLLGKGQNNSVIQKKIQYLLNQLDATNEDIINGHISGFSDGLNCDFHEDMLVKYGVREEEIKEGYIQVLKNPHYYSRSKAVERLGRFEGDSSFELLSKMYRDKYYQVRVSVIKAMGNIEDERIIDFLTVVIKDKKEQDIVRWQAGKSLVKFRAINIADMLNEILTGREDRSFLEWGIEELSKSRDKRSIESLINLLSTNNFNIRSLIVKNLGNLGDTRAVIPLIEILDNYYDHSFGIMDKIKIVGSRIKNRISNINISYQTIGISVGILLLGAIISTFFIFPNQARLVTSYIVGLVGIILFIWGLVNYASYPVPQRKGNWRYHGESDGFWLGTLALIFLTALAQGINPKEQFIYFQMKEDVALILIAPLLLIATGVIIYLTGYAIMYLNDLFNFKKKIKESWMGDEKEFHGNIIIALGKLRDKRAVEILINMLSKEELSIRKVAVTALGKIGDISVVEPLLKMLLEEDMFVRESTATVLKKLGKKRAFEYLMNLLSSEEQINRGYVAVGLGNIGDKRALEPLLEMLSDEHIEVRACAIEGLGKLGDNKAVVPLIDMLSSEQRWILCNAIIALGNIKDTRAVEPLIEMLFNEDRWVGKTAAEELGNLGDKRAIAPIIKVISLEKDTSSIFYFREALEKLGYNENTQNTR